jgi:hypothetical protein
MSLGESGAAQDYRCCKAASDSPAKNAIEAL